MGSIREIFDDDYVIILDDKFSSKISKLSGRTLTVDDVGKEIFRTAPYINEWGTRDYSHVPKFPVELKCSLVKLRGFCTDEEGKIKLIVQYPYSNDFSYSSWNDSNWITMEEADTQWKKLK